MLFKFAWINKHKQKENTSSLPEAKEPNEEDNDVYYKLYKLSCLKTPTPAPV